MTPSYQRTTDSTQIEWSCDECRTPVLNGDGAVWLPIADLRRASDEAGTHPAARTTMTIADIVALPDGPHWVISHGACSAPESPWDGSYWIDVDRIRTERDLLWWTRHLYGKQWFPETDWDSVISRGISTRDA